VSGARGKCSPTKLLRHLGLHPGGEGDQVSGEGLILRYPNDREAALAHILYRIRLCPNDHAVALAKSLEALSPVRGVVPERPNEQDDLLDFSLCLLVDFDHKHLSSQYPEMIRFEIYVPDGWIGIYRDFTAEIPTEARYWMVNGQNVFEKQ